VAENRWNVPRPSLQISDREWKPGMGLELKDFRHFDMQVHGETIVFPIWEI
jgi:hypothetical protein